MDICGNTIIIANLRLKSNNLLRYFRNSSIFLSIYFLMETLKKHPLRCSSESSFLQLILLS